MLNALINPTAGTLPFLGLFHFPIFFLLIHSHGTAAEKQALCNKEQRQAANTLENKKFKIIF